MDAPLFLNGYALDLVKRRAVAVDDFCYGALTVRGLTRHTADAFRERFEFVDILHVHTRIHKALAQLRLCRVHGNTLLRHEYIHGGTGGGNTGDAIRYNRQAGVAVNPKNAELRERLRAAGLPVVDIHELKERAERITGVPAPLPVSDRVVARVISRDGELLDTIRQTDNRSGI